MEFFRRQTQISFMKHRARATLFSALLCLFSLVGLAYKGLNLGLDFTGGTQLELRYSADQVVDLETIRAYLEKEQISGRVAYFGSTHDVVIRMVRGESDPLKEQHRAQALFHSIQHLAADPSSVELGAMDVVGAEVGESLAVQGAWAIMAAIFVSMLYIILRFERRLAVGAAVALLHDPIVILGFFAYTRMEFDVGTLASILAVIGYSLNDTIVVCDRVRENFRSALQEKKKVLSEKILDLSINQTLSRTIMTSFLTLMVVLALLFFGGHSLRGFSTAFAIGIIIGTYSSIYVAGATALFLGLKPEDLLVKKLVISELEHP